MQHGHASDVQVLGQTFHHLLGFLVIGGAIVDHVVQLAVAQEIGAGEGPDERRSGRVGHRRRRQGRGRSHRSNETKHAVNPYQTQGVLEGRLGIVAIIQGCEFQLAAMHAAVPVGLLESGLEAKTHSCTQCRRRAGKSGRLPKVNFAGGNTGNARVFRRQRWGRWRGLPLNHSRKAVNFSQQHFEGRPVVVKQGIFGGNQTQPALQRLEKALVSDVSQVLRQRNQIRFQRGPGVLRKIFNTFLDAVDPGQGTLIG